MPAQAKATGSVSPRRRQLLGKVHIAKKQLGLSNDDYRDTIEGLFDVRSASKLSDRRLTELVEHFKSLGFKPLPRKSAGRKSKSPVAPAHKQDLIRKMRALWVSLYHLAVTRDRTDDALTAFARRVSGGKSTGVRSLNWLTGDSAEKVIEALKKMAEREAGVDWSAYRVLRGRESVPVYKPRARVVEAQWKIMDELGLVEISDPGALSSYARRICKHAQHCGHAQLSDEELDQVIIVFGTQIRAKLEVFRFKTLKDYRERN